jgi:hypothetical protein
MPLDANTIYGQGSTEYNWLKADLAAHPKTAQQPCIMSVFHRPKWTDGGIGDDGTLAYPWRLLQAAGVDVALNGHAHSYERTVPLKGDGAVATNGIGMTEFVAGAGGNGNGGWAYNPPRPIFAIRDNNGYGALKLTFHPGSLDYAYYKLGQTVPFDKGTIKCRPAPPVSTSAAPSTMYDSVVKAIRHPDKEVFLP